MLKQNPKSRHRGINRYLLRSVIFLLALVLLGVLFHPPLIEGFYANAYLNGTILAIFGFGVLYTLKALSDVLADARAVSWAANLVASARRGDHTIQHVNEVLLASPRRGIRDFLNTVYRVVHHSDAAATLPYLLDSLTARGEDRRALIRYLIGALVLLGLIGTFYGLLITIGGVREVIGTLSVDSATDTMALLTALKERLAVPLGGMGMAFSTSLFGLLTSLALAFLELQFFHAQNDLQARLESLVVSDLIPLWQTPMGISPARETAPPRYLAALLQATVERLDRAAAAMESVTRQDHGAGRIAEQMATLGERIETLRNTLEGLERDRTAELRHELRVIAHSLSQPDLAENYPSHASKT